MDCARTRAARSSRRRARGQVDGMVTAETALVMPTLVVLTLTLCWLVSVGVGELRVADAARDAARVVARGDAPALARAAAARTAGDGASVRFERTGGLVTVEVSRRASPPSWLLVPFPAVTLHAASTVEDEHDVAH